MTVSELLRLLKKAGCYKLPHGTNHDIYFSPITQKCFTIPRHKSKEIATGTANSILKAAGLK